MTFWLGTLVVAVVVWVTVCYSAWVLRYPLPRLLRLLLAVGQLIPLLMIVYLLTGPRLTQSQTQRISMHNLVLLDDSSSVQNLTSENGQLLYPTVSDVLFSSTSTFQNDQHWQVLRTSEISGNWQSPSDFGLILKALNQQFEDQRMGKLVFLSDGQNTSNLAVQEVARQLGYPVHTVGLGRVLPVGQVMVDWRETPDWLTPEQPALAQWAIWSNLSQPQTHQLTIRYGERALAEHSLGLPAGPHSLQQWQRFTPAVNERPSMVLSLENSGSVVASATAAFQLTEATAEIFFLEQSPGTVSQALMRVIRSNPLYSATRLISGPGEGGVLWHFPANRDKAENSPDWVPQIQRFDKSSDWQDSVLERIAMANLVVIGPGAWHRFQPQQLLEALADTKVGVWLLSGCDQGIKLDTDGPMNSLLAAYRDTTTQRNMVSVVFPTGNHLHPALLPLEKALSETWRLPEAATFSQPLRLGASLLETLDRSPLMMLTRLGDRYACLLAGNELGDLFRLTRDKATTEMVTTLFSSSLGFLIDNSRSGQAYLDYWPRLAVAGDQVRIVYRFGSSHEAMATDSAQQLRLVSGEGKESIVQGYPIPHSSNLRQAIWRPQKAGVYTLEFPGGRPSRALTVLPQATESCPDFLNESLLKEVAAASGGRYQSFADWVQSAPDPVSGKLLQARTRPVELLHDWRVGSILLVLFCLMWAVRRRLSLP